MEMPSAPAPMRAPEYPGPAPQLHVAEFSNGQLLEKLEKLEAEVERTRQLLRAVGERGIILKGEPVAPSITPYVRVPLDHQVALYIARNSVK